MDTIVKVPIGIELNGLLHPGLPRVVLDPQDRRTTLNDEISIHLLQLNLVLLVMIYYKFWCTGLEELHIER